MINMERIADEVNQLGIFQQDIALLIGRSESAVSRMLSGVSDPPLSVANQLCATVELLKLFTCEPFGDQALALVPRNEVGADWFDRAQRVWDLPASRKASAAWQEISDELVQLGGKWVQRP